MKGMNPRAWSIDGECWCTRVDYDGYKKEWSGIVPVLAPDNRSKRIGEIVDTNIVVEFPTGLKDKNDKEIYEGDIIQENLSFDNEAVDGIFKYIVYWHEKMMCWTLEHIGNESIHDDLWECTQSVEVIGNIHDNPELLEHKG